MEATNVEAPDYFHKVVDCQWACPAHTPVPEYIRLIAQGRHADAYMVNWKSNVFPGILGRTCDRPCEPACRRGRVDEEPVAICRLKRVAADNKGDVAARMPRPPRQKIGKRIACIGAGPAAMTVARDLAPLGYDVTVYDADARPGGMIRSQIPRFRLPESVIDEEMGFITGLGLTMRLGERIDSLAALLARDHDAVFIGTGAPRGRDLDIPGRHEAASNIHIGIDWLSNVSFGHIDGIGRRVIVLGGGNTAMDCCRTSRRLGGEEVKVVVRSGYDEMKASPWEKEDAQHEGIPIHDYLVPKAFTHEAGRLTGVLFEAVAPVVDEAGRRSLRPTGEPDRHFECDDVLIAIGQENSFPWIERDIGLAFDQWGMPVVDPLTFQSTLPKVFFGGDAAFGPKNIIWAVAHGHDAAISIDHFCRGTDLRLRPPPGVHVSSQKMGIHEWSYDNDVSAEDRQKVPLLPIAEALSDVKAEVELGFDDPRSWAETQRCLNCDVQTVFAKPLCIECDACVDICPTDCITFTVNGAEEELRPRLKAPALNPAQSLYVSSTLPTGRVMVKDEDVCLHCGLCAERCPTGAWDMQKTLIEMTHAGGIPAGVREMTAPIRAVNDFVVKFANVNGSGSASANGLFVKAILRMGVPVAARNIFPSNIQGLPTWYEIRVSGQGWMGRRGGVDLMVAMNPQTWEGDLASIESGGYLFYDSTKPMPPDRFRDDITVVGIPLTALCNAAYAEPSKRKVLKNIIYLGALTYLIGIEREVVETLLAEEYAAKPALIPANIEALRIGYDHAAAHLRPLGLQLARADAVGDRIFVDGNTAAALGAVYGGATVCAWYPITPSTSLAEAFTAYCKMLRHDPVTGAARYAIVQAEDEIASIGMVTGAGWNGARAFTCTSGPGISLMQEFIGLSYFAEIPAVIFDVQRGGPSTGMPTRTQQSDLLSAAYASHGDTKHVMLLPEGPGECFEFGALAFDLADRLQTMIFVMLDLDMGMNEWLIEPFARDEGRALDRGKLMTAEMLEAGADFGRYKDVDGDGIPYRTLPATHPSRGAYFTRGTSRDPYARYSEEGAVYVDNMERLLRKFDTARSLVPGPVLRPAARPTSYGVIYYGSTSPAMDEALAGIEARGLAVDALRIRAFPFAGEIFDFIAAHDLVFVVEQNRDAQLRTLLITEGGVDPARLVKLLNYDGSPITARFILAGLVEGMGARDPAAAGEMVK